MSDLSPAGSHHGDPSLSQTELDTCLMCVDWIRIQSPECTWLPTKHDVVTHLPTWFNEVFKQDPETNPRYGIVISDQELHTIGKMLEWIAVVREERSTPKWLPTNIDMLKSRLFWRLRSGKTPLSSPPPTAFSCPWYELIEQPERAHWAYECYVHVPDEDSLWGKYALAVANIGQCLYKVESWTSPMSAVPATVSFGPYLFKVFQGPYETHQYDPTGTPSVRKVILDGWWIQYLPNV